MRLGRIAYRDKWAVLAITDGNDCQVLEFLGVLDAKPAKKLRTLIDTTLRQFVPEHGPPLHNEHQAKHLDGDVYEFKRGPKTGPKVRITFFMPKAPRRTVVCVEAFKKRGEDLGKQIKRAQEAYYDYELAYPAITVVDLLECDRDDGNREEWSIEEV